MAKNPRTINIKYKYFPKYFIKSTIVLKVSFFWICVNTYMQKLGQDTLYCRSNLLHLFH